MVDRKKTENLGKNSPKIQGVSHNDQFRNLSSPMDAASSDTKISALDPLEVQKFKCAYIEKKYNPQNV